MHLPRALSRPGWRAAAAPLLLALSLTQMVGDLAGWRWLRGIGAASGVAPIPKVFSDVVGLETFASDFRLLVTRRGGAVEAIPVTAELYQRLAGPYARRNVYGAALAYAPRLPEPLWGAVFCHALGPGGPLTRELGLPADAERIRVEIATRTRGRADRWVLDPRCEGGAAAREGG